MFDITTTLPQVDPYDIYLALQPENFWFFITYFATGAYDYCVPLFMQLWLLVKENPYVYGGIAVLLSTSGYIVKQLCMKRRIEAGDVLLSIILAPLLFIFYFPAALLAFSDRFIYWKILGVRYPEEVNGEYDYVSLWREEKRFEESVKAKIKIDPE